MRATPRPEACAGLIGHASLHRDERGIHLGAYGLPRRPEPEREAWVAFRSGEVSAIRIQSTKAAEYPEGAWTAECTLVAPETATLPPAPTALGLFLQLPTGTPPRSVDAHLRDLPFGVLPESVQIAADTDGDGRADLLALEYCCKQPWQVEACEYTCGSYWQHGPQGWIQCKSVRPE